MSDLLSLERAVDEARERLGILFEARELASGCPYGPHTHTIIDLSEKIEIAEFDLERATRALFLADTGEQT